MDGEVGFIAAACRMVEQLPGLVALKDLDSRILTLNPALVSLLGLPSARAARGRHEGEVAACLAPVDAGFRCQDRTTLSLGRARFVDLMAYDDGQPRVILSNKVGLRDATGTLRALMFQGTDLTGGALAHLDPLLCDHVQQVRRGQASFPASFALAAPHAHSRPLPARAAECLFYLLRGHTARGIAARLCLSPRTVEGYLDVLKQRFCCSRKEALIERALAAGYGSYLPTSLLFP